MQSFRSAASSSSDWNRAKRSRTYCFIGGSPGGPMLPAAHWGRGSPRDARIFVESGRFRGRYRRIAASWHRKSSAAPFSEDLMCRSAAAKNCRSLPKVQPSAGRVSGAGIACQHRSCHRPRLISFAEMASQRATANESCMSPAENG